MTISLRSVIATLCNVLGRFLCCAIYILESFVVVVAGLLPPPPGRCTSLFSAFRSPPATATPTETKEFPSSNPDAGAFILSFTTRPSAVEAGLRADEQASK